MEFKDQLGRTIRFSETPKRIISLVPSQTELLCDLGLTDALVGVTKFCVHPSSVKKTKTIIGGTKQIHIDKIKALNPDIILCNKEENTKEIVEACDQVCEVHVSEIYTIEDSLELIQQYGRIFNCMSRADGIIKGITREQSDFKAFIVDKPVLTVAYFIWYKPWMVASKNTFIDYLLKLNKFENIHKVEHRYPEVNVSADYLKSLDLVLLSSEPFPFNEKHEEEIRNINPNVKTQQVDGEYFSWYGSRLMGAFKYFKKLRNSL